MIRNRDVYVNPYRGTGQDGIRTGRRTWRDLQEPPESLDAAHGIVHALVLGMAAWALVGIAVLLVWEAM